MPRHCTGQNKGQAGAGGGTLGQVGDEEEATLSSSLALQGQPHSKKGEGLREGFLKGEGRVPIYLRQGDTRIEVRCWGEMGRLLILREGDAWNPCWDGPQGEWGRR